MSLLGIGTLPICKTQSVTIEKSVLFFNYDLIFTKKSLETESLVLRLLQLDISS